MQRAKRACSHAGSSLTPYCERDDRVKHRRGKCRHGGDGTNGLGAIGWLISTRGQRLNKNELKRRGGGDDVPGREVCSRRVQQRERTVPSKEDFPKPFSLPCPCHGLAVVLVADQT